MTFYQRILDQLGLNLFSGWRNPFLSNAKNAFGNKGSVIVAHVNLLSLLGSFQGHLTAAFWALGHTLTSCSFVIDHY